MHFLNGCRREHCPACGPDRHDVTVISEDRQSVRCDRTRGDVKDGRSQLAGNLEHIRDHQQQTLRRPCIGKFAHR